MPHCQQTAGPNRAGRMLSHQSGRRCGHLRDRHRQEGLLSDRRFARNDGRLDPGAAARAATQRHQAAAEPRRPEGHRAGLGDEGEERPLEEVLVRAAGQDVPVLQGARRDSECWGDAII